MSLGQRIQSLRKQKGLTQKDLATISGVCQQMISKLETGCAQHTTDIVKLACALGVSPLWLEGFADRPSESASKNSKTGQQLHHKAVQICIEFLSTESLGLFAKSGFRKQADLFCSCYEMCTQPENKALNKEQLFTLLKSEFL